MLSTIRCGRLPIWTISLDDEEEPRGGWGKLLLVVVALALAVGFGYLHWKQGASIGLNAGDRTAAAKQSFGRRTARGFRERWTGRPADALLR